MFRAGRALGGKIKEAKKDVERIAKRAKEASEALYKELAKPKEERDQTLINSLTAELRSISKEATAIREEMEALMKTLPDLDFLMSLAIL
jgi:seryl-tRNA synthetase